MTDVNVPPAEPSVAPVEHLDETKVPVTDPVEPSADDSSAAAQ